MSGDISKSKVGRQPLEPKHISTALLGTKRSWRSFLTASARRAAAIAEASDYLRGYADTRSEDRGNRQANTADGMGS